MPCILKERSRNSPGIVTFTQNEILWGVAGKSRKARDFLTRSSASDEWMFGVHIQGDLSWMQAWPLQPWQSFFLWPDPQASFLSNVPREKRLDLNCVNFMPDFSPRPQGMERNVDICVISRPNKLKRLYESLQIIRALMDRRPDLTATVIASDPRLVQFGSRTYSKQGIDERVYEFAQKNFSARQLMQISFISSSEQAFGKFPLAKNLLNDVIMRSRFLLLTSHNEGTPRVIAEAFLTDTPCILSRHLKSGIRAQTNDRNTLFIEDDIATAAGQIDEALTNYHRYKVDLPAMRAVFGESSHIPQLRDWLSRQIEASGRDIEGRWFLDELHMRLAGHGQKLNLQIMNREALFFKWFEQVSGNDGRPFDPYDEDSVFGGYDPNDSPRGIRLPAFRRLSSFAARVARRINLAS
jgi:hypothetical protein